MFHIKNVFLPEVYFHSYNFSALYYHSLWVNILRQLEISLSDKQSKSPNKSKLFLYILCHKHKNGIHPYNESCLTLFSYN